MGSAYTDIRSEYFRSWFERGLPYDEYVQTGSAIEQEKWKNAERRSALSESDTALLQTFRRKMEVIVLSGIWCGDCARQGPMLHAIELAAPSIRIRFVENRPNPELQQELRINGAEKVPVVVVLSEDFYEIQRFGDRHTSVYRAKAKRELGPACDTGLLPPEGEELREELNEWVRFFERNELLLRLSPMLRRRYND